MKPPLTSELYGVLSSLPDWRKDQLAYEGATWIEGIPCQCTLTSWTLTPSQLVQWAEGLHASMVKKLPEIRMAIAEWLPDRVYRNTTMPVDAKTLVAGMEIERIRFSQDEAARKGPGGGSTSQIEFYANLRKNMDHVHDKSFLAMVDVVVTLDADLNITRLRFDG
jgi:hypothetical protein